MIKLIAGTLSYTVGTFALAILWHIILFEERYREFGYIEDEPSFALGFLTIFLQGFILSMLYPKIKIKGSGIVRGIKYSLLIGLFFWTSHVLAFVAKQSVADVPMFIVMESFYLLLQFGLFGILIGLIYNKGIDKN